MIPATQIERVPASELVMGDIYAKTKGGPEHRVHAIERGPISSYISLEPPLRNMNNNTTFYRRIRPRHTTLVWRKRHE